MTVPGSVISHPEKPTGALKHKRVNNVFEIQGSQSHFAEKIISFAFPVNESRPIDSYKSLCIVSVKTGPQRCRLNFFGALKFWLPMRWEPRC